MTRRAAQRGLCPQPKDAGMPAAAGKLRHGDAEKDSAGVENPCSLTRFCGIAVQETCLLFAFMLVPAFAVWAADAPPRPHILFLLADDLGWHSIARSR